MTNVAVFDINKTHMSSLRLQNNRMMERFNVMIVLQLVKYCHEDQYNWDMGIPYVLMVYHSAELRGMGFLPTTTMSSRKICLPVDLSTCHPLGNKTYKHLQSIL